MSVLGNLERRMSPREGKFYCYFTIYKQREINHDNVSGPELRRPANLDIPLEVLPMWYLIQETGIPPPKLDTLDSIYGLRKTSAYIAMVDAPLRPHHLLESDQHLIPLTTSIVLT